MKPLYEAMLDPALFGRTFAGPTFANWRTVAKIMDGLPLEADELALFRELTGRETAPSAPAREAYLIKPRRAGGTLFAAAVGLHAALQDYRDRLGPGELATVALIASDRRQARQLMNYVKGLIADSPVIAAEVTNITAETVTFAHRVQLEVHTTSFRSTRGYSYAVVVCDEMAFWRDEYSANPDIELIRAVRPGLANLGGRLLGLSSPHARRGHLFDMYQRHFGNDASDVLIVKAQHSQLNPTIDPKIIERAMAEDPEAARAEWFGEFRGDVSQWLPDELIDAALEGRTGGRKQSEVAFVDVSGGRHDASALAIAHAELPERHHSDAGPLAPPRLVLDLLEHVKAPHESEAVVERFAKILKERHLHKVVGDRYGAEWVVGAFRRHGIEYKAAELAKSEIYMELLAPFSDRRVTLLNDKRLVTELRMLERKPRAGGKADMVDHPAGAGSHDDAANACCGALWLASVRPVAMRISDDALDLLSTGTRGRFI
ncbi:MAG: hypothetical protein M0038_19795 [Pseudomonadota bacterium]|jgi:hypothetical protein|nr:hypothetical protein [Pseudomonadota bacterium]